MTKLLKYDDFIERVNELGVMAFSRPLPGFPSLADETPGQNWFTGDPDTDPWCWKDRAVQEKKLAYGCVLGGNKGFVSSRMYALFYAAFRPEEHMEERQAYGLVSPVVWQIWQLFEKHNSLSTGEIRKFMGVTKKKGGSKVDHAISELERQFYITVAGSRQKIDKYGQPFGWMSNVYDKVENWAPQEWLQGINHISGNEAREKILDHSIRVSNGVNREQLSRMLRIERESIV